MIKQKEIYIVKFDPVVGSEQGGVRPAVVVSGDVVNAYYDLCIVCPISSHIKNYFNCVQLKKNSLNNLLSDSEILSFQIKAVSKSRLLKKIGEVSGGEFRAIFEGLKYIFSY